MSPPIYAIEENKPEKNSGLQRDSNPFHLLFETTLLHLWSNQRLLIIRILKESILIYCKSLFWCLSLRYIKAWQNEETCFCKHVSIIVSWMAKPVGNTKKTWEGACALLNIGFHLGDWGQQHFVTTWWSQNGRCWHQCRLAYKLSFGIIAGRKKNTHDLSKNWARNNG